MKLFAKLILFFCLSTIIPVGLMEMIVEDQITPQRATIIMLVIGLSLFVWIYLSIVNPLRRLRKASRRIADGDLDFSLSVPSQDEIGDVIRDFESMRRRLKESQVERIRNEQETRELISNIAHDLKTPITAVRGYSEGLLDGVASTPEMQERYLHTIRSKASEMANLIDELTLYTQIDTNKIPYHLTGVDVVEFFDAYADDISLDLSERNIAFNYVCRVGYDVAVIADPEQLRRVLNNIVSNSVKYIDKSPGYLGMIITDVGDFIEVSIEDNGKGVSQEELGRIFERFYRTDTSRNSEEGGSGIGLSIVKKIIEDHGGRIWATCDKGRGLNIHFMLRKYSVSEAEPRDLEA